MQELQKVTLISKTQLTEQAFTITFKKVSEFKPGQIIGITTNTQLAPRLYSICSSPNDNEISVLFTIKPDGELTPNLALASPGDTLWITPIQGKFLYADEPAWWIATGTGIAPFHAMHLSGQKPLRLIQGGRTQNDLFFRNDFESLPDYIKCCSKDTGDGIYAGRLTEYLESINTFPQNINYYLCGSAEMVVDVRNLLIAKGISFKKIITEIYF